MKSHVVVSLRSRGLASFSIPAFLNWRLHLVNLITEVSDILVAALLTLYQLSWTSWFSLLIAIITIASNINDNSEGQTYVLIFAPYFAYVVLPLIVLLHHLLGKRDKAQAALGRFRVAYVALRLQAAALTSPPLPPPASSSNGPLPRQSPPAAAPSGSPGAAVAAAVAATLGAVATAGAAAGAALLYPLPSLPPLAGGSAAAGLPGVGAAADDLSRVLLLLADDLHRYCVHKRPYARHIYAPYRVENIKGDTVYKVSRELGLLSRRLQRTIRETVVHVGCVREALAASPSPPTSPGATAAAAAVAGMMAAGAGRSTGLPAYPPLESLGRVGPLSVCVLLGQQVTALHSALEEIMAIKEAATPLLLRCCIRWMVVMIIPVFMTWYWLSIVHDTDKAFGGVLAVMSQLCLLVVLDTVVSLEDPFDEVALNAVSMAEALDITAMMSDESEGDRLDWLYHHPHGHDRHTSGGQHQQQGGSGKGPSHEGPDLWGLGAGDVQLANEVESPPMPPPPAPVTISGGMGVLHGASV